MVNRVKSLEQKIHDIHEEHTKNTQVLCHTMFFFSLAMANCSELKRWIVPLWPHYILFSIFTSSLQLFLWWMSSSGIDTYLCGVACFGENKNTNLMLHEMIDWLRLGVNYLIKDNTYYGSLWMRLLKGLFLIAWILMLYAKTVCPRTWREG